ncbi:hypothetical protein PPL_07198 [Heterostelium album PN500]|uniref:Peptidase C45 hydrolase domain-containing protein n=1 Tax=Heterostelium pallidum (strain ATCC 26659 / Pp 5 / PN500) TaxID=670386 RepID=D3BEN3_HETP5|nr:hypothetical protein PPL_07198 [Heterostelium album PN500]EFA80364.1 hypothetical protein PPL_07198 [Heterostelium album PN500]|eukprot:XP_020432484.1 hypothetical protein PPL_07198 [Heterostelium album PN500]
MNDNKNQSQLYEYISFGYEKPIYLANISGTHYEMGYVYGAFFSNAILETYQNLMDSLLPNREHQDLFALFLDWQFKDYLSKQLPSEYVDEMNGIKDGANQVGQIPDSDIYVARIMAIANLPGDVFTNIEYLLENEFGTLLEFAFKKDWKDIISSEKITQVMKSLKSSNLQGWQCSHFSVFGNRTVNGDVFNGRNLDWFPDTGIAQYKVLVVYHPIDQNGVAKYSHVSVGFAGMLGVLTGISEHGIFVAESGSDSKLVTFDGFAWTVRLRYIMENAANIEEALNLWAATNNTFGMNHMISSAFEVDSVEHPAFALETMKGYTAYFPDNDPAEQFYYENTDIQMGYPIKQAVYRTNHGYDPYIRKEQAYAPKPTDDTMVRYFLFHDNFEYYQQTKTNAIDDLEAVNITSILGTKNTTDFYSCERAWNGGNVVSATFHAQTSTMYIAYEEGFGRQRICACCNVYVKIDLALFLSKQYWLLLVTINRKK